MRVLFLALAIAGVRLFALSRAGLRYAERYVTHTTTFRLLTHLRVWFYRGLEPLAPAGGDGMVARLREIEAAFEKAPTAAPAEDIDPEVRQRLAALDPGNFAWQRELAYGYHNIAVLEDARGRYAEAEQQMLAELALYRAWAGLGVRGICHTHSAKATAFAQAGRELPCLGIRITRRVIFMAQTSDPEEARCSRTIFGPR